MKITSRFTIAVHSLILTHFFYREHKVTSEFIASSVNVNPVIIRKIMSQLKEAGLITVVRGSGGAALTRDISKMTLLDVYNAVDCIEGDLFKFHENPNPACPIGRSIHRILDVHLDNAKKAMEYSLSRVKLSDLTSNLSGIITAD
jgi:Rrf2 family protein